jgi:hypothetical protein
MPATHQAEHDPGARGDRVIADVVRLDKGHTEGLEPHITESLVMMMLAAPGGKLSAAGSTAATSPGKLARLPGCQVGRRRSSEAAVSRAWDRRRRSAPRASSPCSPSDILPR